MNKLREEIKKIATYHSDDGTSGYLLSEEQITAILALFEKELPEKKKHKIQDTMADDFIRQGYNQAIQEMRRRLK